MRARVRERGREQRGDLRQSGKTSNLRTLWWHNYDDGETSNLRTFGTLVTMLQNTPNLLQNPVTQLFGKYPPKSNTKRFKNSEREREIDIIYIYVTL